MTDGDICNSVLTWQNWIRLQTQYYDVIENDIQLVTHLKWQLQISVIQFWLGRIKVKDISNVIMTRENYFAW